MGNAAMFLSTPQAAERLGLSLRTLEAYQIMGEAVMAGRIEVTYVR